MKTKLFLTGLALAAMVAVSSAQVGAGNGRSYGDGVCDENCVNFVDNDNDGICDNYAEGTHAGNGYRRGLAWNGANSAAQELGQAFRRGQTAVAGRNFRFGQGRGPASEGRHLFGPGTCILNEE